MVFHSGNTESIILKQLSRFNPERVVFCGRMDILPMRKLLPLICTTLVIGILLFLNVALTHADQLDDLTKQINDLTSQLNSSINATRPLQSQLDSMQQQITNIQSQVAGIDADVATKKKQINDGYIQIAQKEKILNATIRDFYIKSSYNSPLLIFLSGHSATQITQILAYNKASANQDKAIITNIALSIQDLQNKKQALQDEETRLSAVKADLDTQSAKLATVVNGAKAYQASLSSQIAVLSAQQQQLLAAKYATLGIPLYATTTNGCSSDISPYKDPGFSGTKFGFFTYGVPNRVGLNQYGAMGRAAVGQSSDTILHAYYNFDGYQNFSGITINVNDSNGYNSGNIIWSGSLEDYMQRIYEVPDSWPSEALKAQVIAARSYVLAETNNGAKSICATQSCQVFQTNPKGGNWANAVSDTSGQAMVQGGQPITAWFSSTHGGYVYASGGDVGGASWTKSALDASGSVNSFADLQNNAYDKASPWFYCDWGGRSAYNNTAWLQSSEVADIVNAIALAQNDSSTKEHLYQTDKPNPAGTDTWDANRVQQELKNRGVTPFTSISSISVSADFGSGKVNTVSVNGDGGTQSFAGDFFKTYFDLRAPANIQIVGPLYNIEQR